jgi:hypothetical protein
MRDPTTEVPHSGHVWTAPWQGLSDVLRSIGRVRSRVRPFDATGVAAGPNALRGSSPNRSHALAQVADRIPRVPGTAVFVARLTRDIPPIVVWHLRHIRSLRESIVIVNVITALVPYVAAVDRVQVREIAPRVWAGTGPLWLHGAARSARAARARRGERFPG